MNPTRCKLLALAASLTLTAMGCGDSGTSKDADDSAAAVANVASFTCPDAAKTAGKTGSRQGKGPLQIVTTVAPITSIVANIAGDRAQVTGIIPEGEDSHTFEPKPSAAAILSKADVVFVNGLKLEDPTKDLATTNLNAAGQIIELGTLTLSPQEYIYDFSFPRDGGKPNPHLWTNPPMARCYVEIVASVLSKADPTNVAYYEGNAAKYNAKLDMLDVLMTAASAKMPIANRRLLTYHDAYAYFAAHYGWKVIGAIQVSSFEDPTPREIAMLIKQVKQDKVPAVFGSEVFPSAVLTQLSKEAKVKYVDKLRDDDLPGAPGDSDHSYLALLKFDFVTMVSSLGGDASDIESFDSTDVAIDTATYPQ